MAIEKHELKVSTTGSAGSASGSAILAAPLSELVAMYVDYHASAPATTDLTLTAPGNPASVTVLTLTNNATDGWYYPKAQKHDNTGSAVTGDYADPVVHSHLNLALAQCDALTDAVVVTFYLRT
jgi:hypothetical protein